VQLNGTGDEYEADLSYDGLELYYVSTTAGMGPGPSNILVSQRPVPGAPWGPPQPLGPPVNTATDFNDDPRLTQDGLTMFYTDGNAGDIVTATRQAIGAPWGNKQPFAPANSAVVDHSPYPEGNGEVVFFSRTAGGSVGSSDFFYVWQDATGGYSAPQEAVDLNSTSWDSNAEFGDLTGRAIVSRFDPGGPRLWRYCRIPIVTWVPRCVSILVPKVIFPPRPPWIRWCRRWIFNVNVPVIRWFWYDWWRGVPANIPLLGVSTLPNGGIELPGFDSALLIDPTILLVLPAVPLQPNGLAVMQIPGPFPPSIIGASALLQTIGFDPAIGHGVFSEVGVATFQ
jgi:hypothetical protein